MTHGAHTASRYIDRIMCIMSTFTWRVFLSSMRSQSDRDPAPAPSPLPSANIRQASFRRSTSKQITAPAAATLSDSTRPTIGIIKRPPA